MSSAPRATRDGGRPPQQARRLMLPRRGAQLNLFRDVYGELKKVVWPTRQQVVNLSVIVTVASIAVGLALGSIDWLFTQIVQAFLTTGSGGRVG